MARSKFEKRFKVELVSMSFEDAINGAFSDVGELADEMETWKESIPENLQGSEKYSMVEAAYDTLNDHRDEPSIDYDKLGEYVVQVPVTSKRYKSRSGLSRDMRLSNATAALQACVDRAQEIIDEIDDGEEDADKIEIKEALESLMSELENPISELDGNVEFPGMFG